jgi:hypothetical protein
MCHLDPRSIWKPTEHVAIAALDLNKALICFANNAEESELKVVSVTKKGTKTVYHGIDQRGIELNLYEHQLKAALKDVGSALDGDCDRGRQNKLSIPNMTAQRKQVTLKSKGKETSTAAEAKTADTHVPGSSSTLTFAEIWPVLLSVGWTCVRAGRKTLDNWHYLPPKSQQIAPSKRTRGLEYFASEKGVLEYTIGSLLEHNVARKSACGQKQKPTAALLKRNLQEIFAYRPTQTPIDNNRTTTADDKSFWKVMRRAEELELQPPRVLWAPPTRIVLHPDGGVMQVLDTVPAALPAQMWTTLATVEELELLVPLKGTSFEVSGSPDLIASDDAIESGNNDNGVKAEKFKPCIRWCCQKCKSCF